MGDKYLPIGSVVMLKDGQKALMIVGYQHMDEDNPDKVYDYLGCLYPEGILTNDLNFLFNHEDVVSLLFQGYINAEEQNFMKNLKEIIENGTINGEPIDLEKMKQPFTANDLSSITSDTGSGNGSFQGNNTF